MIDLMIVYLMFLRVPCSWCTCTCKYNTVTNNLNGVLSFARGHRLKWKRRKKKFLCDSFKIETKRERERKKKKKNYHVKHFVIKVR